jgi:predicted DNA-binding transcriptional regulator AlpA
MNDSHTLDDFITLGELAEAFGVSERSIGGWRGLPRVRIGRVTFFRKADVGAWLDRKIEGSGRHVTT